MKKEELYNKYCDLILKWNKSISLTATDCIDEIKIKHIEDSKAVLPFIGMAKTLVDLGSGGGFPGIPIKIEFPQIKVTLVDSKRRKINFLKQAIHELSLKDIDARQGRAEDPVFQKEIGTYDIIISRATWSLSEFLQIARGYMHKNSKCIAMKGPRWEEELKQAEPLLKKLDLSLIKKNSYNLSSGEQRIVLVFESSTLGDLF